MRASRVSLRSRGGAWWQAHPYLAVALRGAVLEGLGISIIKQMVHGHWSGVLVSVFLLRFAASNMTGHRIVAHTQGLHRWDFWYALGSLLGAALGLYLPHLIYHPDDGELQAWLRAAFALAIGG